MDGEKTKPVAFDIALPCLKMNQENPDEGQSENYTCEQQCTVETGDERIYVSPIPEDFEAVATLFDELLTGSTSLDMICNSDILQRINRKTKAEKDAMQDQQTAKLWVQYLDMLDILQTFNKAECTGNWQLHLQAMHEMLSYLAASGHNLCTKPVHIYLQ